MGVLISHEHGELFNGLRRPVRIGGRIRSPGWSCLSDTSPDKVSANHPKAKDHEASDRAKEAEKAMKLTYSNG
jgi:hypothetical protein